MLSKQDEKNINIKIFVTDPGKITSDDYNVIYDKKNDIWTLTSESLKTPVTGTQSIETEGFKLSFFGNALDGDELEHGQCSREIKMSVGALKVDLGSLRSAVGKYCHALLHASGEHPLRGPNPALARCLLV